MTNTYSPANPIPLTLIADDQPDVATALRLLLRDAGYQTEAVATPDAVLEAIQQRDFDLVLMDLNYARDTTSGREGLDLITEIRKLDTTLPVVVLTGWGTVEIAVEAMQRGVHDFVQKPWDNRSLIKTVERQIEVGRTRRKQIDIDAESRRVSEHLDMELADAEEIQRALLPKTLPTIAGLDVAVAWRPAQAVGGDFFDVLKFDDDTAGLYIADVAGKGMPAALLMSNAHALLKSVAAATSAPHELCARVNDVVCENIVANRFISCFYAHFNSQTQTLAYTNAGHCPPMLIRNDECIRLKDGGPVLGVFSDRRYFEGELDLQSGDCLVLFTDGVTEAQNASGDEFGEDRMRDLLTRSYQLPAPELRDRIMGEVDEFSGSLVYDDATLMVIKVA